MSHAVFRDDAPGLPIADGSIVNDRVERAQPIDLLSHAASLCDAREIADHYGLRAWHSGQSFLAPPLVACMQNYLVPPLNDKLSCHSSKPIGRTRNEHSRHDFVPLFSKGCSQGPSRCKRP